MRRWTIGILACLMLVATASWMQRTQIYPRTDHGIDEDLLYLPNENLITHFTAGLSGVLADLLWIQTISYASEEFNSKEKKFTWLQHMVATVTRMDPYYEDAYATGGMMLAALGQDDRALPLLQRGLVNLPRSTRIPEELVSIYLLNRRKDPGAAAMTLHYMNILAQNSSQPQYYIEWMDRIRRSNSLEGEARRVWLDLFQSSTDDFVRDLARAQIAALDAESAVQILNKAVADFVEQNDSPPQSIDQLLRFLGDNAPQLYQELGEFYIDDDHVVRSSLLDVRSADRRKRSILAKIDNYFKRNGAFPESLDALLEANPDLNLQHPRAAYRWRYDPSTGNLTDEPIPPGNGSTAPPIAADSG